MLTVPHDNIAHISHSQSIHKDGTCVNFVYHFRTLCIHLHHITGLENEDVFFLNSQLMSDRRLCFQMPVLPMHRYRILGMHQRIDQLDLFLAGMS